MHGGVGDHAVVDARAALAQRLLDPSDHVGLLAQDPVGHHHRALDAEPLDLEAELAHRARAEHDPRRLIEAELEVVAVRHHSSRNLVGTAAVASTSALEAAKKDRKSVV